MDIYSDLICMQSNREKNIYHPDLFEFIQIYQTKMFKQLREMYLDYTQFLFKQSNKKKAQELTKFGGEI